MVGGEGHVMRLLGRCFGGPLGCFCALPCIPLLRKFERVAVLCRYIAHRMLGIATIACAGAGVACPVCGIGCCALSCFAFGCCHIRISPPYEPKSSKFLTPTSLGPVAHEGKGPWAVGLGNFGL